LCRNKILCSTSKYYVVVVYSITVVLSSLLLVALVAARSKLSGFFRNMREAGPCPTIYQWEVGELQLVQ
jgi:hypothetical protein